MTAMHPTETLSCQHRSCRINNFCSPLQPVILIVQAWVFNILVCINSIPMHTDY